MNLPKKVTLCEVVTRDGFQTAPEIYPVEEKVRIIEEVVDAGCRSIEVGVGLQKTLHLAAGVIKVLASPGTVPDITVRTPYLP